MGGKIKEVEDRKKMARIDTNAAKRFIRNALWDEKDKQTEESVGNPAQSAELEEIATDTPTHIRFDDSSSEDEQNASRKRKLEKDEKKEKKKKKKDKREKKRKKKEKGKTAKLDDPEDET